MLIVDHPGVLALLFAIPALAYLRHVWPKRGGSLSFPFDTWGSPGFDRRIVPVTIVRAVATGAFWIGAGLLIIALAGPYRVARVRSFLTRGVDIVIAIDQSPSMAARDFQPTNRFEAARDVIRGFVASRENDPIGLVGFGLEAGLRVAPTLDYEVLLETLDELYLLEMGDGTAIGMGIAIAAMQLRHSDAPRRVLILLTDGVNNAGEIEPVTAARVANELGVSVYVIGIGGQSEVEIELTDPATGQLLRGTIRDGFDEVALRAIAEQGGGRYFFAGSATALQAAFDSIDTVERVEQRSMLRVERTPLDQLFILIGFALVLLDFFVRKLLLREVFP
ncbi:MAG: VWA domain-containing protein [Spirochaetaceae bacterium]|nr:MAG: VWA domain-containing protein [Spirochaetaceae bacterium]